MQASLLHSWSSYRKISGYARVMQERPGNRLSNIIIRPSKRPRYQKAAEPHNNASHGNRRLRAKHCPHASSRLLLLQHSSKRIRVTLLHLHHSELQLLLLSPDLPPIGQPDRVFPLLVTLWVRTQSCIWRDRLRIGRLDFNLLHLWRSW